MIACRVSALAGALAIAIAAAASAQIGPPMRLIPGSDALPPPARVEQGVRDEGILRPPDAGTAGIIDESSGGLPATLWSGSRRSSVDPLLATTAASRLPTLRAATRRALASSGPPPAKEGQEALPDFAALRARALFRLGDAEGARELAERAGRGQADEVSRSVIRDALLLAPDPGPGCSYVRDTIAEIPDPAQNPDWYRALIACQTIEGDGVRAQLGLTLLREQNVEEDDWLDRLVAFTAGSKRALDGGRAELRAHHIPLFAAAKTAPPATAYPNAAPPLLAAIARSDSFPLEARLRAGEPATALSAIDGRQLAALYDAVTPTQRESADAVAFAEKDTGPRGRAALFKAVQAQKAGPERAQLLARALPIAERRGAAAAFRRAVADLAAAIPVTRESAPHAGVIARILLADGRIAEATRWYDLLGSDSGLGEGRALLAPLLFLGGAVDRNLASAETLRAWRVAQQAVEPNRAAARTRLLGEIFDALGLQSAELAAAGPGQPVSMPAQLIRLSRASGQRQIGETILLANAALNEPALRDNPTATGAAIRALRAIGLNSEARFLALDAALAAGL